MQRQEKLSGLSTRDSLPSVQYPSLETGPCYSKAKPLEGDSMRQEFSAGFHNIEGWQFGTCKVLSFAGRRALGSPRWNMVCTVCRSQWQDGHFSITESGQNYKCRNVACGQLHRIKPSKPAIEHDEQKPEPRPEPIQTGLKVSPEYARYAAFVRRNGHEPGSYQDFSQLDDVFKNQLMAPVESQEVADELERIAREDLRRKYGI